MARRRIVLATDEIYHIFTRGVAKQPIFTNSYDYIRIIDLLKYYRFTNPPLRFSHFYRLHHNQKKDLLENVIKKTPIFVEILAFCFMPNHFHLLIKQSEDNGISKFMSNFLNSYVRYYNTKHKRVGPLFQSNFKTVRIENNEQLIHINRYIHLNPTTSYLIKTEELEKYPWSSLPYYLGHKETDFIKSDLILKQFKDRPSYREFIYNQIDYQKKLGEIKHLALEK